MSTDDPRHGTYAGYVAGCRNDCCRTAARRYQKRRVYEGKPRRVSSLGTRRRIEALACLGWDMYAIARHLGTGRDTVRQWTMHETVYRRTHERMVAVYDELSMRLPPQDTKDQRANVAKTRNRAARMGWYPPLSWDEGEIDDPDARPYNYVEPKPTKPRRKRRTDVDENVVLAVLAGERRDTTPGEKQEIGRRWRAMGKPMAELARVTGWTKVERYGRAA
jgi:hypothetical protein